MRLRHKRRLIGRGHHDQIDQKAHPGSVQHPDKYINIDTLLQSTWQGINERSKMSFLANTLPMHESADLAPCRWHSRATDVGSSTPLEEAYFSQVSQRPISVLHYITVQCSNATALQVQIVKAVLSGVMLTTILCSFCTSAAWPIYCMQSRSCRMLLPLILTLSAGLQVGFTRAKAQGLRL